MVIQVGAKIVVKLKNQNILTLEEAERLIAFTNNSGPLFILGTVGVSLLNDKHIGYILLISHLVSCILVGIVFRNWKNNSKSLAREKYDSKEKNVKISDFGEILSNSIRNSIITVVTIGGFIIFFSVIISILNSCNFFEIIGALFYKFGISSKIGNGVISGIIELTNGLETLAVVSNSKMIICIISFMLGFGGLSVLFQVYSIISKENISIKPYFYGKILQGIFSFFITWILGTL